MRASEARDRGSIPRGDKLTFTQVPRPTRLTASQAGGDSCRGHLRLSKQKILVIVGPTASGKSELAVKLAKKFGGEIISADSRQVYRGLDIGSGKVPRDKKSSKTYFYRGVPHHLLGVASPKRVFTVFQYQKLARQKIEAVLKRGRLPIVCGGTGFYIDAALGGVSLPPVPPNHRLRRTLYKLDDRQLYVMLKRLDPKRSGDIDRHNPRRLIRAIEIATALGRVPPVVREPPTYRVLKIGLRVKNEKLKTKIKRRLEKRLRQGLIEEVRDLHEKTGLSWRQLEDFGLEYRYVAEFLQKQTRNFRGAAEPASRWVKREEITSLLEQLEQAIWHYAKRQMTWFKRDPQIKWVATVREAVKATADFLKKID